MTYDKIMIFYRSVASEPLNMVAQKKISESFDPDRAREYCKEEIKKKIDY